MWFWCIFGQHIMTLTRNITLYLEGSKKCFKMATEAPAKMNVIVQMASLGYTNVWVGSDFIAGPCRSSLCSSSSFSSSCSGTRSSLVSRLNWVCGPPHSVGLLSDTCCRGTPSPALKSDILCTGIASFSWSARESRLLQGCLEKQIHMWSERHVRGGGGFLFFG